MKIAVGISGGVDSAVAAFLLKRAGHEVVGTMMTLWDGSLPKPSGDSSKHACFCHDEEAEIEASRRVCDHIGIPLHVVDCAGAYSGTVLDYFRDEYLAGRTPNPCVVCNQRMKFGLLPRLLEESGVEFDKFATGHYCRVEELSDGVFALKKGADERKDQSYFLYRLSQEQLSRVVFPLGGMRKEETRRIAEEEGLPVPLDTESQDFYSGDYADLIPEEPREGEFVDLDGNVLGHHQGYWRYTVGQRRGLGVSHSKPLYVVSIDAERNRVVLGESDTLLAEGLKAEDTNFIVDLPEGKPLETKIRSASSPIPCRVEKTGQDAFDVFFETPTRAVAPGQSCVLYDGDIVIGGGVIAEAF